MKGTKDVNRNKGLKGRLVSRLLAATLVGATALTAVTVAAEPASAAIRCQTWKGFNTGSGGCDGDGTADMRLVIRCRVVGSYFEYNRYSGWFSRYTSWWTWLGCGDQGRTRAVWVETRR